VYLVFASLIVPALGTRHYRVGRRNLVAGLLGSGGYLAGLLLSLALDLPSGALIVCCIAGLAMLAFAVGPKAGVRTA
jgi:zinc/manganese transport system permease protein